MLARFSGDTVGSTVAKRQRLRYNGDFELLAEPFAEGLAEEYHAPAHLTLHLFLSRFRLIVKSTLEEDVSNWVQAS